LTAAAWRPYDPCAMALPEAVLLDLDDTLHNTPPLAREYATLAFRLVARHLGVDEEEARRRVSEERARLAAAGSEESTMSHALLSLGVSLREWVDARDTDLDPAPFIRDDEALRARLRELSREATLAVVTNNTARHARVITERLGVREFFGTRIFAVDDIMTLKPDPAVFRHVAGTLGVAPEKCLSVGDRPAVDLEPASAIGMRTMHVEGAEAIYAVLDRLLSEFKKAREEA
jgi:HAD superfamily hydrolase (TIGR01509 family)